MVRYSTAGGPGPWHLVDIMCGPVSGNTDGVHQAREVPENCCARCEPKLRKMLLARSELALAHPRVKK